MSDKKRAGRPSHGERDGFNIKLSLADGAKIRRICKAQGISFQDLLQPMIQRGLSEFDMQSLEIQEGLFDKRVS